jgi:hypothetical protein
MFIDKPVEIFLSSVGAKCPFVRYAPSGAWLSHHLSVAINIRL